ncbi:MAG TPA: SAM-dependent chlorinase/fluorinase [Chitinophagales bacterium]|nr:SAM-dependent chlorinase/fluorinase [Chitinophagales bacterium]
MIITLTTDLGTRDYYAGVVKGELLKAIPDVQIIDISHEIEPYNILHGAFVLKNSYRHFPEGTIHLIGVNPFHDESSSPIIVKDEGYFFIGQDNGLFGLIWDERMPKEIFRIRLNEEEKFSTMPLCDVYVRAAKHLALSKNPEEIAEKIPEFRISTMGKPIISNGYMKGSIVYFDRFGNAMVNIRREEFQRLRNGRNFLIVFKRYADMDSLSINYAAVDESEKLCFFNSSGFLEIAINKGNARNLLNLNVGDFVQIEFEG